VTPQHPSSCVSVRFSHSSAFRYLSLPPRRQGTRLRGSTLQHGITRMPVSWAVRSPAGDRTRLSGVSCPGFPSARARAVGRSESLSGKVPAVHLRCCCGDRHLLRLHRRPMGRAVGSSPIEDHRLRATVGLELGIAGGKEFHLSSPGNKPELAADASGDAIRLRAPCIRAMEARDHS
jgi:hypothetical protein